MTLCCVKDIELSHYKKENVWQIWTKIEKKLGQLLT